ncbi:MAG: IS66 family insertion sequence element accessory protein TnpB [Bryobacteraceae bacterium]
MNSLARLCQEKLQADPLSGCLFVFRSRRRTSIRILVYGGQGFGWRRSGCRRDGLSLLYRRRVAGRDHGSRP